MDYPRKYLASTLPEKRNPSVSKVMCVLESRDSSNGGIRSAPYSESWSVEDLAVNPQFIIHPLRA